jgi:creatinine amidohydrolase
MLALSKQTKMSLARKGFVPDTMTPQQKIRISRLASRQFIKATKTGVWGDPTKATKKDGQKIFAEIVANLSKAVSKLVH